MEDVGLEDVFGREVCLVVKIVTVLQRFGGETPVPLAALREQSGRTTSCPLNVEPKEGQEARGPVKKRHSSSCCFCPSVSRGTANACGMSVQIQRKAKGFRVSVGWRGSGEST